MYEPVACPAGWDGATEYARLVDSGERVECEQVVSECRRHLEDISSDRWDWVPGDGWDVVEWIKSACGMSSPGVDPADPRDCGWVVEPWMYFWFGRLFGMKYADGLRKGYRRFGQALLITGRGSGKTKMAAYTMMYGLAADGNPRPECYIAARDSNQALFAWENIKDAFQASGMGQGEENAFHLYGGQSGKKELVRAAGGSMRVISGKNAKSMVGGNPHFVLLDEYEQHQDEKLYNHIIQGEKANKEPLTLIVSNAGESYNSACGRLYIGAKKLSAGEVENDSMFPLIYEVDKWDDPLGQGSASVKCRSKANPSYPRFPDEFTMKNQVDQARMIPYEKNSVLRAVFGRWVSDESSWLPVSLWDSRMVEELPEDRFRWRCWIGVDLSERNDLTAAAIIWAEPGGKLWAEVTAWIPADNVVQRQGEDYGAHYQKWIEDGLMEAVPGDIIDFDFVASWVAKQVRLNSELVGLTSERFRMIDLRNALTRAGVVAHDERGAGDLWVLDHPTGPAMGGGFETRRDMERGGVKLYRPRSIEHMQNALRRGEIWIKESPLVRYAADGVRVGRVDGHQSREYDFLPKKVHSKIDPVVALTLGVGFLRDTEAADGEDGPGEEDWDDMLGWYGDDPGDDEDEPEGDEDDDLGADEMADDAA